MTESTLQHEGSPPEVVTISDEDSDFYELKEEGEEILDEVVVGSSQGIKYPPVRWEIAAPRPSSLVVGHPGAAASQCTDRLWSCCAFLLCVPLYIVSGVSEYLRKIGPRDSNMERPTIPGNDEAHQPGEDRLGSARLGYGLKLVRNGLYEETPSSLIIFDFDFNYDDTCAITKADITIIFGSKITEQPVKPGVGPIVPFATDIRWPRKASGPSSDTEIKNEETWKLKLGAQGFSLETPENKQSVSGKKTDSSWRIAGGPVFGDKPFRCRRGFLWRVNGHEFNRFPVPESFSLGMIVRHDLVDYWVKAKIDGSLRGIVRNFAASLWSWKARRPNTLDDPSYRKYSKS